MAVKLPDGVIRVKEGLRKREMKGGLNITCPLKKKKNSIDEFWKKRGKDECGCERERSVSKSEMVQMSSKSPGFDCHGKLCLKNTVLWPKII